MSKATPVCAVCNRDPDRMNSDIAECSHIECPARRKAWSDRKRPTFKGPWPKNVDQAPIPLDKVIS